YNFVNICLNVQRKNFSLVAHRILHFTCLHTNIGPGKEGPLVRAFSTLVLELTKREWTFNLFSGHSERGRQLYSLVKNFDRRRLCLSPAPSPTIPVPSNNRLAGSGTEVCVAEVMNASTEAVWPGLIATSLILKVNEPVVVPLAKVNVIPLLMA